MPERDKINQILSIRGFLEQLRGDWVISIIIGFLMKKINPLLIVLPND